ncbi:hypothetical protein DFJ77DRAFT_453269 [Powellomyces hirtus]|nr:hypothetical protein DFJ77DRAFT_453269 [Powellomyces hirtus]
MPTVQSLALPLSITAVVLFGLLALIISRRRMKKGIVEDQSTEFFLTARRAIPLWRIGWSFFASVTGSWVVYALPAYAIDKEFGAGYLGLMFYAIFTGVPIILVAHVGERIRNKYPHVLSWGDFANRRFGPTTQILVSLIVLLNMGINLTAEYTTIGLLFKSVVNVNPLVPIIIVGTVTMVYTAVGGLYASIVTDQYQGFFTITLMAVTAVYVAVTFRLPDPRPPLPPTLDANYQGYTSIVTMGVSLICATFFSDAVWQRVWASQDSKTLFRGAAIGAGFAVLVAFFFGFGGFLAAWSGYAVSESGLGFFDLITKGNTNDDIWVVVLVVILASVMNESAVDAFQSALTDTVASLAMSLRVPQLFGYNEFPLMAARLLVIFLNVPIVIVAIQGYNINLLYLITNMTTSCATLPMVLGLSKRLEGYVHGRSVNFGILFAMFSVATYGRLETGDYGTGIRQKFYAEYDWVSFIIALCSSVIGVSLAAGVEVIVRRATGKPIRVFRKDPEVTKNVNPAGVPRHNVQTINVDGTLNRLPPAYHHEDGSASTLQTADKRI